MVGLAEQYVCKMCGFNIIGYYPEFCPFCGASHDYFITSEECSRKYKIISTKVNNKVMRLNSSPPLGLEHAAYSIEINGKYIWIDCPSTFNKDLEAMDKILFTHHHFLGASNLFRSYYTTFIWIHKNDSKHAIASRHPFDRLFEEDFELSGIKAFHIDGHTPGFTIYIFEDVLFICDYFFLKNKELIYNPYGSSRATKLGASKLKNILRKGEINIVCGYNYVLDFIDWKKRFDNLLNSEKGN